MHYTRPSFSVAPCGSDAARDEYDRIFRPRKPRLSDDGTTYRRRQVTACGCGDGSCPRCQRDAE